MKRASRICCTLALLLISLGAVPSANAVGLLGFSPDPATLNGAPLGFNIPAWFQDQNGVALQPCLDVEPCGLGARVPDPVTGDPGFDPALPLTFPNNFPEESFYFNVDTGDFQVGPFTANFGIAMEIVFNDAAGNPTFPSAPGVVATPFQRLRFTYTYVGLAGAGFLPPGAEGGNYTFSNPWGDTTISATDPEMFRPGIGCGTAFQTHDTKCVLTRDLFSVPPDFAPALGNGTVPFGNALSTFLQDPAAPLGFLSDGLVPALTFTGAPVGRQNRFSVTDPLGNTGSTTQLRVLFGKKFGMEVSPTVFDFGELPETTTSPAKTVTVTNINTSDLTLGPLTLTGPNLADFTLVAGTCSTGAILPAAANCTFTVAFAPKSLAPEVALRSAMVNIPGSSAGAAAPTGRVSLSGTAQLPLTVAVASSITDPVNAGTGTLTSTPPGINCSSDPVSICTAPFAVGTIVTLVQTPTATPVSILDGWAGACTGTGACTVTMDAAKGAPGSPAVTANFVTVHNVTTSATPAVGGTITASTVEKHGSSPTLTIIPTVTPTTRYRLESLTDNGTTVTPIAVTGAANPTFTYTLPNIAADHTIVATFVEVHGITTSATPAAGGTITTASLEPIHGSSPTLTITPTVTATTRYRLGSLTDNGTPVTPVAVTGVTSPTFTHTIPSIAIDHTIVANFIQQFILTPSQNAGGSVTPATAQTVDSGTDQNFTITADPGYRIGSVLVDNAAQIVPAAATTFQVPFAVVAADHGIQATFVKIWNVASTVAGNGSVDVSGTLVVDDGETPGYTFTPSSNKFQVGKILVDDLPQIFTKPATISGAVAFTLPAVKAHESVSATFVPSGDLDENGTVDVADALKALRIFVEIQTPDSTDKAAMKIGPLDAAGVPTGGAGDPDLNDIILILKKAVAIVKW